jgi:hypothetical protein
VGANLGANLSSGSLAGPGSNAAGGYNSLVSVEALQEFRILTSSFAPEFGRTPGGQITLLTRSGTNDFHGAAYEYFRNDVLDANDWFANQAGKDRSPLRFNDFGGTFGGPVIKNNTFFFFSYEGQRLLQPQFEVTVVPDVASRQAASLETQGILNAFPIPNGASLGNGQAEFSAGFSNPLSTNATSFRLDHIFSPNVAAFVRYSYAPSSSQIRGYYSSLSVVTKTSTEAQTVTGGVTYTISPHVTNEFRLNWSDNSIRETQATDDFGGAQPLGNSLFISPLSPSTGLAEVYLGFNNGSIDQGLSSQIEARQMNLTDALSYTRGTHQLKFGTDYLLGRPINSGFQADDYSFTNVQSAVSNSVSYFTNYYQGRVPASVTSLSLYAQDAWKASARLTVTYGLRWDFNPPPRNLDFNNGNYIPLLGDYLTGAVHVGTPGSSYWDAKYTNFAPRVGVAYQLGETPGRETVIRLGAGLYYDLGTTEGVFYAGFSGYPNNLYTALSSVPLPISPSQAALPPVNLTNPPPGSEFTTFPRDYASPRTWEWNLAVQQALGASQSITVSYVGALGRELEYPQYYPTVGPQGYDANFTDNAATSDYNALQVQFQHQLSHGLTALASYTFAHSLDDGSSVVSSFLPATFLSPSANRGPSDFDVRHAFSGAFSYNIPGLARADWLSRLANGWGLDGIVTARSALPVDVYEWNFVPGLNGYLPVRPNLVPGQPLYLSGSQCAVFPGGYCAGGRGINPAAFVLPADDGQGDLGRNALRGFDLVQADISIRRSFRLTERVNLLFRTDFFNLFNHPNFANPDNYLSDATFGQSLSMANSFVGGSGTGVGLNSVFQTGGPRLVQFSLKLSF